MRRLICLLAAAAVVAGPLATAGRAVADDHRGGGGRGFGGGRAPAMGRVFGGGERGFGAEPPRGEGYRPQEYRPQEYRPQEYRPQEYRQPAYRQPEYRQPAARPPPEYRQPEYRQQEYRPDAYRGAPPAEPRNAYRGEGQAYAPRSDPRYDPRIYAAPPSSAYAAPRRGGYMGQGGPVINDYDRYRLRPPPPGYDWVRTSRGAALVSRQTRQIFDVVPY